LNPESAVFGFVRTVTQGLLQTATMGTTNKQANNLGQWRHVLSGSNQSIMLYVTRE